MERTSIGRGEIVYLAAEVQAAGRIHEIGTRAEVRSASDSGVELELGGTAETVWCPTHHVVRARGRRARARVPGWTPLPRSATT